MYGEDLVRAWKDPEAGETVAHPSGEISLDDVSGGAGGHANYTWRTATIICCSFLTDCGIFTSFV